MRRLIALLVCLSACAPSWETRLKNDLAEADAAESRGEFIRALQIYGLWKGKVEEPKMAADVEQRERNAADRAMAQGEALEAERQHLKAAQHYERLQQVASHLLGERLPSALARSRNAAYDQVMQEARECERAGRYRDAVVKYESIELVAQKLGKEGELANALQTARGGQFDEEVKRGQAAEERRNWKEAVSIYQRLDDLARRTRRTGELEDHLRRAHEGLYDDAKRRGDEAAKSNDWDRAIRCYEEAQSSSRKLGRDAELERAIQEAKVSRGLDRAVRQESEGRWEEAIRTYEDIAPLARQIGRGNDVETRLGAARERRYEQAIQNAEQFERNRQWSRALQEYRSVRTLAGAMGRDRDIEARINNALVSEAIEEGKALEAEGRWGDAIAKYETVATLAESTGRGQEVGRLILDARSGFVRSERRRAQDLEKRRDYDGAIRVLEQLRPTVRQTGDQEGIEQDILRVKGQRFETALDTARELRNREDFQGAIRTYESVQLHAPELGREEELGRLLHRCREEYFDFACAGARSLEQQERWDESIEQYLKLRDLARSAGQEAALDKFLFRVRSGRFDACLLRGRQCERNDDWNGAIAEYERACAFGEEIGRRADAETLLANAREEKAAREFVPDYGEEDSYVMPGDIVASAYDASGTVFVAADSSGQVWVFDISDRCACRHKLDAGARVHSLALSNDGAHVAVTAGSTVFLWETRSGQLRQQFDSNVELHALAFTADGESLAIARDDGPVELWDWRRPSRLRTFRGHGSCVKWMGWLRSGDLVTACGSGEVRRWDPSTGRSRQEWTLNEQGLRWLAFGAKSIATVGADGMIQVWDVETMESQLRFHYDGAVSCSLAGRDRYLMVADSSGNVTTYEVRGGRSVNSNRCHAENTLGILSPLGGTRFTTYGKDRKIKIWVRRR